MTIFNHLTDASAILRIGAFFLIWLGCWLPLAIPLAISLNWRPFKPLAAAQKLPLLVSLYVIAPLLLWGLASLEGVPFSNYGLPWNPSVLISLGLGLGLALLSLAVIFGFEWAMDWMHWQLPIKGSQPLQILLVTLLLGLWISGTEELIFRGFLLNELYSFNSAWIAAIISSLIFAGLHLVWEVRETLPQLPGLWLMGMVLVLARWVDGGHLGLAWGLHAGWIWGIASIDSAKLIAYTSKVPAWLTGVAEKPLAGVAGILCLLFTSLLLVLLAPSASLLTF